MKSVKKIAFFIVVTIVIMTISILAAFAAKDGSSVKNAIEIKNGKLYSKTLNKSDYDKKLYAKITLPSNGLIDFSAFVRCQFLEGCDYCNDESYGIRLTLYSDKELKKTVLSLCKNSYERYEFYSLPLNKGTYYLEIDPSEHNFAGEYSSCEPYTLNYKYTFSKTEYWESEPNEKKTQADSLTQDYLYKARFTKDSDTDYYSVKLTKGKHYTLRFKSEFITDSMADFFWFYVYNSEGTQIELDYYADYTSEGVCFWKFEAPETDTYYIHVNTDGVIFHTYPEPSTTEYRIGVYNERIPASKFSAKLSYKTTSYNGKVKAPKVTVKDPYGNVLKEKTDYTITYPKGRKSVGEYTIKIKYIGEYKGSKKLKFIIKPPATNLASLTANEEGFAVKWNKQTTQTTGYQIQYSTNSKYKNAKTVNIKDNKTLSKKISKLKAEKKYYVRVRTYKTVDKTKYYSDWTKTKSVTTKRVSFIKIKNSALSLYAGSSKQLSYSSYPTDVTVKWSSDNTAVAKVSANGKVTAVKKGTANITAQFKYSGKVRKSTLKVTVKAPTISLNKTKANVYMYGTLKLKAKTNPSGMKVHWKSADTAIATVSSNGTVTGVKKGTTSITAYFTYGGSTYKSTMSLTVKNPSISLDYTDTFIYRWDNLYLCATTKPSDMRVYWKSSNTSVATVDSYGEVTGVAPGDATITAYFVCDGKTYSKSCKITVYNQNPIKLTDVDWYTDYNNALTPKITIQNNTGKTIKYIGMDTYYKDKWGSPIYCDEYDTDYKYLYTTRGLEPYETKTFNWNTIFYSYDVSRIDFDEITITYIDNTTYTFDMDEYWYDSNYYYQ